jgi:hypothetical protein
MKNSLFTLVFLVSMVLIFQETVAQIETENPFKEPVALTPQQMYSMSAIPPLTVPAKYLGPDAPLIPFWIDNSTQPFFRPIGGQVGLECGQSAGIGYNFTYEVDRLRNLAANVAANQYPSHFAWDFLNGGTNMGVSCFDSWEIVRACGTMNVADYGGTMSYGGYLRWINGYDKYYAGMSNRINYMRSIRCDSPEGLQTLKYWLYDHLEGAMVGGVANIYGQYYSPTNVLPNGTPEAGKFVQTAWGASPSHTWTVCGYNDSIRFDYNQDGQFTNTIDINADGVVNMKDWEIGGFKIANGYAGTGWSNQGFCYVMYKCLADNMGLGGIWNHSVYVIDVKQTCAPKLTAKITLKHTSRNKLKVTMGVSTDLSATVPSYVQEYPIFKFQGGDFFMQGGTTEADKTIEFGLDLTGLINQVNNAVPAKFFLQVQESDPTSTATGEVVNFSLIDYTGGTPYTVNCASTNVPVANNTTTRLTINYTLSTVRPDISTAALPPANLYQPYSYQLTAINGSTPYLWDAKLDYPETTSSATFQQTTGQQLVLTNNNSGYSIVDMPFDFPFYKRTVDKLYIYSDGYVTFDDQPFTWPYLIDKMLLFKYTAILSPFMADLCLYPAQGDGVWFLNEGNSVTIRWETSIYNMSGTSSLSFSVKLYKDGKIEFYYGNMNYPTTTSWTGGICSGDNKNYQFSLLNNSPTVTANTKDQFTACGFPVEMQISEDGIFSGTPVNAYQNRPINFIVTDNNNLTGKKVLNFSTNGLLISYTVNAGGDSIIEFGETANINLSVTNIGSQTVHNINAYLTKTDPFIVFTDSTQTVGDLGAGQTATINNAFSMAVSPVIPNNHAFTLALHISSTEHTFQKPVELVAFSPDIKIADITVLDGDNGRLDAGETTDILLKFKNSGGAKANNVQTTITSIDPFLIVNNGNGSLGTVKPDSIKTTLINVTGGNTAPFEHLYSFKTNLTANNGYVVSDTNFIFSGDIIEDFETGNYNKFDWYLGGNGLFYVDALVDYEGNYSTRSGWIYDNEESTLNINVNVIQAGLISFYKMVSCENDPNGTNYDWLGFYVDNMEMGKWDGSIPWSKESFFVSEGYHTFKWVYHKDYSVVYGSDCAWIDFITFPPFEGAYPVLSSTPTLFEKSLDMGQTTDDQIFVSNDGGGIMNFAASVFDTSANKKDAPNTDNLGGSYINCYSDGFVPGETFTWSFVVHNLSADNEYIKGVKMDLPPGVIVNTATNYSGGSLGELVFQGSTGNGASLLWQGTSAGGRGVIKPGETATTMLSGTIDETFMQDAFVVYSIRGDSVGADPHNPSGYVKLNNFSLPNGWLTLTNNFGTLFGGQSDTVNVHFSAQNLAAKDYTCKILMKDRFNNNNLVPVTMHVLDTTTIIGTVNADVNAFISCYPNPFSSFIRLDYQITKEARVTAEIFNMNGNKVKRLFSKIHPGGRYQAVWDGTGTNGSPVAPGVYYCRMQVGDQVSTVKIVLIR